ncbi:MAG: ABC transporter ATP-binding protein/permease [Elusimicrobia bacterium]|nr:ABC transporter ATP-binding protein/permease [Elusimicrobiota bacterium]
MNKTIYKRLLEYFKEHKSRFITAVLCMAGVSALNGMVRLLIKPMIDKVFIQKDAGTLSLIVIAIPSIYLLLGVLNYAKNYLMSYIAQKITLQIRNEAYSHLQFLSMRFHTSGSTGRVVARLTNDISFLQTALNKIPATAVLDVLTVMVLMGIMFYLNWKFALVSLVAFPVASIPIIKFTRKMRDLSRHGQKQMAEIYKHLGESLGAINITKAFNREKTEIGRFSRANRDFYELVIRFVKTEALSSPIMEFLGALAIALVLFFAAKEVIGGYWSAGSFFAFFGAAFSIYQPLRNFAQFNPQLQQALSASERIFEILEEKPEIIEMPGAQPVTDFKKSITFDGVGFRYNQGQSVLKDVSFEIKKGEIVALVGPSGSGKTTIAHLLLRFYNPSSGKICLDGEDITRYTSASLRELMGVVTQEPVLFNESVLYNISYGKENATEEEIINAATIAHCHPFITKMPGGYNTVVGERGVLLSGGEKQRIAIARAIIKDPKILILDEATSALDAESEKQVQAALEKVMEGRTTVIIAHRLATVKKANKIVVLEKGSIVDAGTHEELFKKEGLYRRLHQLQII